MPRSSVSKRIRYNILYLQSEDMKRLEPLFMPSAGADATEFSETIICSGKCQKLHVACVMHKAVTETAKKVFDTSSEDQPRRRFQVINNITARQLWVLLSGRDFISTSKY